MILCVDTRVIDNMPYVQKDIELQDILLNYTNYYPNAAEAEKDRFVPLDFSVSVRSTYSNLVLQIRDDIDNKYLYYVNHTNVGQFVHKGYDLVMYLSAIGFMSYVEYSYAFDDLMLKSSTHRVIGLYNPDAGFFNPIVYSHIIIDDGAIDTLKTFLKCGVEFVPLSVMRQRKSNSISAMLDTLIDVKEKGDNDNE